MVYSPLTRSAKRFEMEQVISIKLQEFKTGNASQITEKVLENGVDV